MDRLSAVLQKYDYSLKLEDITKRVENIIDKHLAENMQKSVFAQLIGFVDLTSLKTEDTDDSISALVEKVNAFDDKFEIIPHPAAICVYPSFVGLVKSALTEDIEIAAVAGGFPHSQTMIEVKVAETSLCIAEGATEIDVVIPVGKVLSRQYEDIFEELTEIKSACHGARLKQVCSVIPNSLKRLLSWLWLLVPTLLRPRRERIANVHR